MQNNDFILEIQVIGNAMKVNAINTETGIEVTLIMPKGTKMPYIKQLAAQKLAYVKNKHHHNLPDQ